MNPAFVFPRSGIMLLTNIVHHTSSPNLVVLTWYPRCLYRISYGAPGNSGIPGIMGNRCWYRLFFFSRSLNFTKRHGLFSYDLYLHSKIVVITSIKAISSATSYFLTLPLRYDCPVHLFKMDIFTMCPPIMLTVVVCVLTQ